MKGHRLQRVSDAIRRRLAELLRTGVRDPRVGFVTVTGVKLTADMRHATIWVTTLDSSDHAQALAALEHASPFLRRELGRDGGLKHTPELHFRYDESIDTGLRIDSILDSLDIPEEQDAPEES